MLQGLQSFGGLRGRIRLTAEIAEALVCSPAARLVATYKNQQQKMVDQMIALDALFLARSGEHGSVLVLSDDDDFVPAVIAVVAETSSTVCWVRQRAKAHNDFHFDRKRVELLTDARWP